LTTAFFRQPALRAGSSPSHVIAWLFCTRQKNTSSRRSRSRSPGRVQLFLARSAAAPGFAGAISLVMVALLILLSQLKLSV